MSHQISIFFAAAIIGISCIVTDASARGGGGGGHGGGGPMAGKTYNSMTTNAVMKPYNGVNTNAVIKSYNSVSTKAGKRRRAEGVGGGPGRPGATAGNSTGSGTAGATGATMGAAYYAPPSYNANTVCGRYPYPSCKKVPVR
jgi:hypothetical protein